MAFNITKTEAQSFFIPDGLYTAQVASLAEATGVGKYGKWYALKFQFTLYDQNPEINAKPVTGMVFYKMINGNPSINPGDKLDSWFTALGVSMSLNTQFDAEKLVGAPCFVKIVNTMSNGKQYSNVDDITAYKQTVTLPTAPTQAAPVQQAPVQQPMQQPMQQAPQAAPAWVPPAATPAPAPAWAPPATGGVPTPHVPSTIKF